MEICKKEYYYYIITTVNDKEQERIDLYIKMVERIYQQLEQKTRIYNIY